VFAGGTDPAADVSGVSGTASYRGEAAGTAVFVDETGSFRVTSYDQAPVALTADFDAMRMSGGISFRRAGGYWVWHDADGYHPDYELGIRNAFHGILPERIAVAGDGRGVPMEGDGSWQGALQSHGIPGSGIRQAALAGERRNRIEGQFHQPDGNDAPGSVLGTFVVRSDIKVADTPGGYLVQGGFGAERQ